MVRNKPITLLAPLILGVLLLTGCTDFKTINESVVEKNKHIEDVLSSYDQSKQIAQESEQHILDSLVHNTPIKEGASTEIDVQNFMEENVPVLARELHEYIEQTNEEIEAYVLEKGDDYDGTNPFGEPILMEDIPEFVNKVIQFHYFLDTKSGVTEQFLLIKLPNGVYTGLSIYWIGGMYLEAQLY